MFLQTWNKYLPIIRILFKRSINAEQKLDMNRTDFEKAAAGRKVKYAFKIVLVNGRIQNVDNPPPLAKNLVEALQQDEITRAFLKQSSLLLTMNNNFQLLIKNNTPPDAESQPKEDTGSEKEVEAGDSSPVAT